MRPFLDDERARWRGWQQAHQQALSELQAAAQEYHRLVVGHAFTGDDHEARRLRNEALSRLQERQRRLDELREQQPTCPP